MQRPTVRTITAGLVFACIMNIAHAQVPASGWQAIVRGAELAESQGVQANLRTIRTWVLTGSGFCDTPDRHILFDRRMRFVGYMSDVGSRTSNQNAINKQRERLAVSGKVDAWAPGDSDGIGYPFVLSCHQPDARLPDMVDAYTGKDPAAQLWGTWDGMQIGSPTRLVSLHEAVRRVYEHRFASGRIKLPASILYVLAGKVIIESGGERNAHSAAGARGILQLAPEVLRDCRIPKKFHLHRLAQIDCALALLQRNWNNLSEPFSARFGTLPPAKRAHLWQMLLTQAYHGGIGRISALLTDGELAAPASYFAANHARFSAGDIALGLIYHNLGREQLGFASLYYVTDVYIAADAACAQLDDLPGCARTNPEDLSMTTEPILWFD